MLTVLALCLQLSITYYLSLVVQFQNITLLVYYLANVLRLLNCWEIPE